MVVFYFVIFLALSYFLLKRRFKYWTRCGIEQVEPELIFGNIKKTSLGKSPIDVEIQNCYKELKRKGVAHGGIYLMHTPVWLPVDLQLIKQITTTDYNYFTSHGFYHHENEPLTNMLFTLDGARWKSLRAKLSPTFTPAKVKSMFDILNTLGDRVERHLSTLFEKNQPLDVKESSMCFGIDIVAACFFGIECNSFENPKNEFRVYGKALFNPRPLKLLLERVFNWNLLSTLGYKFFSHNVASFFVELGKNSIIYREKNNIKRNDYLDLLIQLKNKGKVDEEKRYSNGDVPEKGFLSFNEVIANMVLMYAAGFETTSTAISYLMYELAKNQEIQEKARQEIVNIVEKSSNNKLSYDDLDQMRYCDMCIKEIVRMYPPLAEVPRMCTKTYKIPGTEQVIQKGTMVLLPAFAIHRDEEFFSNPKTFDPENFNPKNENGRAELAFLGFGCGPKYCLGFKFAYMQIKVALAKYLMNYRFTLNSKTPSEIQFLCNTFTLAAKDDLLLDIFPLK